MASQGWSSLTKGERGRIQWTPSNFSPTTTPSIFSYLGRIMPVKQVYAQPPPLPGIQDIHPDIDCSGLSLDRSAEGKLQVRIHRRLRFFVGVKK
jgi:hypothetical protein